MYNSHSRWVDFLFTGLAVVPAALLFHGHPGPALLLFVPLLIGACLCGLYEQQCAAEQTCRGNELPSLPAVTESVKTWHRQAD